MNLEEKKMEKEREVMEFQAPAYKVPKEFWADFDNMKTLKELEDFCKRIPSARIVDSGEGYLPSVEFIITEEIDDYIGICIHRRESDGAFFESGWSLPPERRDSKVFAYRGKKYIVPKRYNVDLSKGQITYIYG